MTLRLRSVVRNKGLDIVSQSPRFVNHTPSESSDIPCWPMDQHMALRDSQDLHDGKHRPPHTPALAKGVVSATQNKNIPQWRSEATKSNQNHMKVTFWGKEKRISHNLWLVPWNTQAQWWRINVSTYTITKLRWEESLISWEILRGDQSIPLKFQNWMCCWETGIRRAQYETI